MPDIASEDERFHDKTMNYELSGDATMVSEDDEKNEIHVVIEEQTKAEVMIV